VVYLEVNRKNWTMANTLDTGSQWLYILKTMAFEMEWSAYQEAKGDALLLRKVFVIEGGMSLLVTSFA
jgi:hypothetical protein